jgi:hypothetical protein
MGTRVMAGKFVPVPLQSMTPLSSRFVLLEDEEPGPGVAGTSMSPRFVLLDDEPHPIESTTTPPNVPLSAANVSPSAANVPTPGGMLDGSATFDPRRPLGQTRDIALEGEPDWQRAAAGAGKALSDTGHGIVQAGAELGNFISDDLVSHKTVEELRAETDETAADDAPAMEDPAFRGGNLAGHVAIGAAMPARSIPSAIASAAAYGAAQPVGTLDSRTENAAAGLGFGALGSGVAGVIGRSLRPVRSDVPKRVDKLMDYAESKGFKFSAGQRTGSRHLQNAEAALDTLPTSGSPLGKYRDHNQKTANRIVAKEMGEEADTITPDVIERARARIGKTMDGLTRDRQLDVDHRFFDDVFRIRAQYGQTLKGQQSAEIRSMLDELAAGSGTRKPQIEARQYQDTASALKKEAEASFRTGTNVNDAKVKREIAEALEGLAERNYTGEELKAFREARRQYSATLIAEKAVRPDESGDIVIEKLHQATKTHRRVANRQGAKDDLVMLGRLGHRLKKSLIPNSGTAERSWWLRAAQSPMSTLAPSAGLGIAGATMGSDPYTGAAMGLGAPWLLSRGMYSAPVQAWLKKGLPMPGRNHLIGALSRTAPGAATGISASEGSAR